MEQATPLPSGVSVNDGPNPAPAAVPAPSPAVPQTMATGGPVPVGMASVNWVEIGFCILAATALFSMIYFYRYKMHQYSAQQKKDKMKISQLNARLSVLEKDIGNTAENSDDDYDNASGNTSSFFGVFSRA